MLLQKLYRVTKCNRILQRAVLYKNICAARKVQDVMHQDMIAKYNY